MRRIKTLPSAVVAVNAQIKRLLITRHDKIGDFVLALPLCKAIKNLYPEIQLTVLVSAVNFSFAKELEFIDDVILYSEKFNSTLSEIRKRNFDASISCYIDLRLGWMLYRSGIEKRFSPATKFAQVFFNQRIKQRRSLAEKTEWEYNLELGGFALGVGSLSFEPPLLRFPPRPTDSRRVVFHPGFGGSSDGNLRLADYVRLARSASMLPGVEVVFTFGPDDHMAYQSVKKLIDFKATLLQSEMSLYEFCGFLSESVLLISTSTGPMHLAGAVNTPTISFFGDSLFASSRRWATISHAQKQRNFAVCENYSTALLDDIEALMVHLLSTRNRPDRDEPRLDTRA